MVKTFDLTGKVALITGGYGHLGSAITRSLIYHGATVYVLSRSEARFLEVFRNEQELGTRLFYEHCDISESKSIAEAFSIVAAKERKIDVLINNAFYLEGQDPLGMSDQQWTKGIQGTLDSVFKAMREVVPYMKKSGSGRIINVSSMYGMVSPDLSIYDENPEMLNPPHYGAAKAGVIQLTRYYANLLGKDGITVNAVSPGPFPGPAVQEKANFIAQLNSRTSLGRIGKPDELAGIFIYLASDASSYTTGQVIAVDGGWTSR